MLLISSSALSEELIGEFVTVLLLSNARKRNPMREKARPEGNTVRTGFLQGIFRVFQFFF
jgi:hypothetical protein